MFTSIAPVTKISLTSWLLHFTHRENSFPVQDTEHIRDPSPPRTTNFTL